ncbi:coiled-coil domain-containing protein 63-like [Oncorhynchus masou masou]|uniref:coiled-coil domain-containing protein 63-like n=1 Tax=Oncorhynchus masou masou TaxID=90313 RepID=UPI00318312C0
MPPKNPKKTDNLHEQHQRLLVDNDSYLVAIRKQKEHLASLDTKMKEMQTKLLQRKKEMGGRIRSLKRPLHQRKHIRIMEVRVNQATKSFDKLLCSNQALRDEIDHLRRQRCSFALMYQRLSRELLSQHNVMEDLVEKSVLAYDQRSEALARMLAVRERSKKDTSLCHTEMTELKRVIDHEIKLRSFMVQKSKESVPIGEDEEAKKRRAEQAQRERMGGESLETYQAVHRLLVEMSGNSDLRQLGRTFVENEEKSFAYFNYINELNNNSTMLKDRINKLRTEILHFELENKQYDQQWQGQLKELERELEQRRGRANNLESQYTVVLKFLDQHKTAIAHLFNKMKCNPASIIGKLGCSAQVTDDNVTQFIGILEEEMHQLLMFLSQCSYKEAEEMELPPQNLLLVSCSLLPTVTSSATEAPSFDDSTTEALLGLGSEQPLDFQTLRERVLPRVMHTEQGKVPKAPSAPLRGKKKVGFNPKSA